jgi:hypothetical protein
MTEDGLDLMGEYETEYLQSVRPEDYYDLIELPDGHHVPVPIVKRLVGQKIVESIPVSRKVRNQRFFYCVQCDQSQTMVDRLCIAQGFLFPSANNGYSFFRCKIHKLTTKAENDAKESMLLRLILGGLYRSLRYVEAER